MSESVAEIAFMRFDNSDELKKCLKNSALLHDWSELDWPNNGLFLSFVAHANNTPVGFIVGHNQFRTRLNELEIAFVVVHEDHRKKGIGSKLLNNIEQAAIQMDVKKFILYTEIDGFLDEWYKRHGYDHQSPAVRDTKMVKSLTD